MSTTDVSAAPVSPRAASATTLSPPAAPASSAQATGTSVGTSASTSASDGVFVARNNSHDSWVPSEAPAGTTAMEPEGPIRAYAKLEFPGFSYYIQTLEVTIGRRPQVAPGAAAKLWRTHGDIDVDLGPLKSISRLHARIFYSVQPSYYNGATSLSSMLASGVSQTSNSPPPMDTPPEGRFMLEVLGRNGAFVDDVWVSMKGVVPLGRRCVSTQSVKLTQNEDPNRRACVLFCVAAPCHRR